MFGRIQNRKRGFFAKVIKYFFSNDYWKLGKRIFDPCNSNIAQIIPKQTKWGKEMAYKVFVSDIATTDVERFKKTNYYLNNIDIITIVPDNNLAEIVKKCIESARRIAALYMPLKYLLIKDKRMEEVFRYREPARVYACYPRK